MSWQKIQAEIDSCQDCLHIGGKLLARFEQNPVRSPQIHYRPILFISEAPPRDGGFYRKFEGHITYHGCPHFHLHKKDLEEGDSDHA